MRAGVDEAGKGPVLGSMFAAAVAVSDLAVLPEGIADSKRLAPERRERLASALREDPRVRIGVAEITPRQIDDPETDMNGLTVEAHAAALTDAIDGEENHVEALADAADTDEDRFARRVRTACPVAVDVTARHEADDDDPLVAAASIVAKVERDAHVARLADEHGDLGSGYPSDSTTREFLKTHLTEHGELPSFVRSSWSTCETLLAETEQRELGEF